MNAEMTTLDLETFIEARDFASLREEIRNWPAGDLAEVMEPLSAEKEAVVFRLLPREQAAKIFSYLPIERQQELLKAMAHEEVVNILNAMSDDDRTDLLDELPAQVTQRLLNLLSPDERRLASQFLGYPENSVGRLMTPHFVRVKRHWTIAHALDHIRRYGLDSETMSMIYVIDEHGHLIDDLRIRHILLAAPETLISDLMDERFVALNAYEDREVAVEEIKDADLPALPVTDSQGMLIGIVTVDDIFDVAEEEATEDIHKLGGSEALEEPYMEIAIPKMVRKRATWLVVLFLSEMLTATAMGKFETEIAKAVVLSIFVPLVISSGGNSGSQASTLIIRADGARRSDLEGLVACNAARNSFWLVAGWNFRGNRFCSDHAMGKPIPFLRRALVPISLDRRLLTCRHCFVGIIIRFDAALPSTKSGA